MNLVNIRQWATPITIGAFIVMSITGVLMFFHLNVGLNKIAHEWMGLIFVFGALMHVLANSAAFMKHLQKPLRFLTVLAGVAILAASFYSFGDRGKPSPRMLIDKLLNAPLESVSPISGKSQEEIKQILQTHGITNIDLSKSAMSITKGENREAFELMTLILKD